MGKPIWVFVVGTYRTGSTTQYRIVEAIVQREITDSSGRVIKDKQGNTTRNGVGIGYHKESRLVEHDDDSERYIVCKVFRYLPHESETAKKFLLQNRMRVIGTVRDPRDVFVSMQERERNSGRWDNWDPKKRISEELPKWFSWFNQWTNLPAENALITKFEEMILDLTREALRIARFLQIPLTKKQAAKIASEFTIPAQIRKKKRYWDKRHEQEKSGKHTRREHPVLPSIPGVAFGTSGHWKQWLHPQQAKMVMDCCAAYAHRWGYK